MFTPGVNDVARVVDMLALPPVTGKSVLDIGTCNGAMLFELERRGAARVVGVDIYDDAWFGFGALREFLGSSAEFHQSSVYGLEAVLDAGDPNALNRNTTMMRSVLDADEQAVEDSSIGHELYQVRNTRQPFQKGFGRSGRAVLSSGCLVVRHKHQPALASGQGF